MEGHHNHEVTEKLISNLTSRCYIELIEGAKNLAIDPKSSGIPSEVLRCMAVEFPQTRKELLAIPGVTKTNLKYAKKLLGLTTKYSAEYKALMQQDESGINVNVKNEVVVETKTTTKAEESPPSSSSSQKTNGEEEQHDDIGSENTNGCAHSSEEDGVDNDDDTEVVPDSDEQESPQSPPPPPPERQSVIQAPAPSTWSWSTTFVGRQKNLLTFGFFSDFTVIVGAQKHPYLVHKAILASSSPILYNAVLRLLSEGVNVLLLPDDDVEIFKLFLQYLYTGQTEATFLEAFSLQNLALKYKVPDLVRICETRIANEEFTIDSAYVLLPLALNSSHVTLISALLNFICKNGTVFIKDKRFASLPETAVLEIIKRDDLAVKHEMEVLSAVVHWGQAQCKLKNLEFNDPANFGPLIERFLRHIRFPCDFSPKFWLPFLKNSAGGGDGSKKKTNTNLILRDLFNPRHVFNPYNKTVRKFSEILCLVHSRHPGHAPLIPWRCKKNAKLNETLLFHVNFPFTFYGFSIVRGIFGENFEKNDYDYRELIISTTVVTNQSLTPVVEVDFRGNELRAHFQQPVDVQAHKWMSLIITFSGNLKFKAKISGTGDFQRILISNCDKVIKVGTGMDANHSRALKFDKMILPIMCEFRRLSEDPLPIDKGFISSLLFSLNRPHPQGRDTSREQTNHLPLYCAVE